MKRSLRSTFGAAALAAVFLTGCSQSMSPGQGGMASPASTSATPAASLRTALNTLFAEHVYLAAAAHMQQIADPLAEAIVKQFPRPLPRLIPATAAGRAPRGPRPGRSCAGERA